LAKKYSFLTSRLEKKKLIFYLISWRNKILIKILKSLLIVC